MAESTIKGTVTHDPVAAERMDQEERAARKAAREGRVGRFRSVASGRWRNLIGMAEEMARPTERSDTEPRYIEVPEMRRGGRVCKGGLFRLHKGERVLPARKRNKGRGGRR